MKHSPIHVHERGLFAGRTMVNIPEGRFYAHPGGTKTAGQTTLFARHALRRTGYEHLIANAESYTVLKRKPYGYTLATAE